jgi:hypothetical protein
MAHNCVGLFCEDIREEVSGTHTIIGVMPDTINLAATPTDDKGNTSLLFPRLGIYLRVNLDASQRPAGSITARATIPGMSPDVTMGEIGADAIDAAFAEALTRGNPIVGLIFKAVLSPLQIRESGRAAVYASINGQEILGATLNMQIISSSAVLHPSGLSQPFSPQS